MAKPTWSVEPITFSGVTDCYQPAERKFQLTRQCLEVAVETNQPVSIVTKNALILRDLDLLRKLASKRLVHVYVSITTLDPSLARDMEPRTSIPAAKLRAIQKLSKDGVPTGVMVAPVIPALNDSEIPAILSAAKEAGAKAAGYVLLRLPLTVQPVFEEWIKRCRPDRSEMVLSRVKETRGGKLNDSSWGQRIVGTGLFAQQIRALFKTFQRKLELDQPLTPYNCDAFQRPSVDSNQLRLF